MAELAETNVAGAEKRRSTRVIHSAAIIVKGTDALGRDFRESTKTVIVNCFGCQYQSTNYPATNSAVMLEIRHADLRRPPRVVPARVIWVQRPKTYRALYHVGIEFEVAGNVWDIALPPEDWFPCPEDEELVVPVAAEENGTQAGHFIVAETSSPRGGNSDGALGAHAVAAAAADDLTQTLLLADEIAAAARQESVAIPAESADAIRELVKISAAEAVADEIAQMRQRIDAQLQESIDRAVNTLIERIAQSPALQHLHGENGAPRSNSIEGSASPNGNGDGDGAAAVSSPPDSPFAVQANSRRKRGKRHRTAPEPTA